MALTIQDIEKAQDRIAPYIMQTPLLRLSALDEILSCRVYVKAECMQTTGAFKLRGAMNKLLSLSEDRLKRGVVAASSGNHGRALAYAARQMGIPATIVLPDTAPQIKRDNIAALGGKVVISTPEDRFKRAEEICMETGATLVPPYNDEEIMAGQGTAGLELVDQYRQYHPDAPLATVITPVSGGGLLAGLSTAVKDRSPETKVIGAEPAALPAYSVSLAQGVPTKVPVAKTISDALISLKPGDLCFPYVQERADGVVPVEDRFVLQAMEILLMEGKILAEPSSCIGMAAILEGKLHFAADDTVCFLLSGGNVSKELLNDL